MKQKSVDIIEGQDGGVAGGDWGRGRCFILDLQ